MINLDELNDYAEQFDKSSSEQILKWASDKFAGKIIFSTALGPEAQVILDIMVKNSINIQIFTLDTGRLFNDTYELIAKTEEKYNTKIQVYFPKHEDVENMIKEQGINLFYKNQSNRKQCCYVRKIIPLERAMYGYDSWICGLRKGQSITRETVRCIEWDKKHQMIKINPLANWSEEEVWNYIRKHDVPYNKLHENGFKSIGCSCCTRKVKDGEHSRSGRWWWEPEDKKECGLHIQDGKVKEYII